jgi:hypothetical protein
MDVPDMDAVMGRDGDSLRAGSETYDRVLPETLVILVEE